MTVKIENKLNILLFTDADVFAGTERHILDLAMGLRTMGVNATIACPRPGALATRAAAADIPVVAIPKIGNIDRNAIHQLVRLLNSAAFDLIHAHNGRTHIAAAFAVKKARRGICIATQHFLLPARTTHTGIKAIIASFLHRRASAHTAGVIAISNAVRDCAIARRDDLPEKITTILNGSSPPDLTDAPGPTLVRSSLGLEADTPFIFCAARLQAEKDIPTLLSAMRIVMTNHPKAHCLIAGEGDQKAMLERLISDLHLAPNVQLLGFRHDIPSLLRACDLFVLPAAAEPFGLVLLEAMALARPVIATSAGGPPEIVRHGETGLLVAPKDPAAMASAINKLLDNPNLRNVMGSAGHARYCGHFTVDRMARDTLALYRKLLNIAPTNQLAALK